MAKLWDFDGAKLAHRHDLAGHTDKYVEALVVVIVVGASESLPLAKRTWLMMSAASCIMKPPAFLPACPHAHMPRRISVVCMSSDGNFSITASWDTTARLWSNDSGQNVRSFEGHTSLLYAACLSNDGHMLITGSNDKTARVRACCCTDYFLRLYRVRAWAWHSTRAPQAACERTCVRTGVER